MLVIHSSQQSGVELQTVGHLRMIGSQGRLADTERALEQWLYLGILALSQVYLCQGGEADGDLEVLWPQSLLPDLECTLAELLGLRRLTLGKSK
jgi:hypothetical protein